MFREQHRPEDPVDGSVGADEEPLDRAGDEFLADGHGHHAERDREDLDDHEADDHEPEVPAGGVDRLAGEEFYLQIFLLIKQERDREQRPEELCDEL